MGRLSSARGWSLAVCERYDYEPAARQAGLSPAEAAALRRRVEDDYPSPTLRRMRWESICQAIGRGEITLADALKPPGGDLPPLSDLRLGG